MSSTPKLSRKAGEGRLGTPSGRSTVHNRPGLGMDGMRPFDRSRNAEKRDPGEARHALIERMARRRRESWKRERRNPNIGRPYGPAWQDNR